MALVKEMPVAALAALIGETDMRIWRVVHHYVDEAVEAQELSGLERAGIDETSAKRGQDYVSVFADLDERRAVYVTEGRDQRTVQEFSCFLECHGGEVQGSGLGPLIRFTRMLEDHWLGVMRWHHSRVSNGLLEGLNSLIQAAKRRARGYRTNRNYIAMIYLVAGKLNAGPAVV